MTKGKLVNKIIKAAFVLLALILSVYLYVYYPILRHKLIGHNFTKPDNSNFIVAYEPHSLQPPVFLLNMIRSAFSDFNVEFIPSASKPDLIIRTQAITKTEKKNSLLKKNDVPYVSFSGEPKPLSLRNYRRQGPPFAQVVATAAKKSNEIYVPFISWCGLEPQRLYTAKNQDKSVAYVSRHCTRERDAFFKKLEKKVKQVYAYGPCCNNTQKQFPKGNYASLSSIYSQHNFVIAMENSNKPGYITEKMLAAYNAGAIPIFWGDSVAAASIFNVDSYIDIGNFDDFDKAAQHIANLQNDPKAILAMKKAPLILHQSPYFDIDNPENEYIQTKGKHLRYLYDKLLIS